ncbi:MAG: hypothetical protein JNL79_04980 [Myxococcales bacterium]|nr:hypothetical protein [Myxococcales bacterium]
MLLLRSYTRADREGCVALFDSNVPAFFAPAERASFVDYLDDDVVREGIQELVLVDGDRIIACGGLGLRDGEARMCWGIVHRERHGQHLGDLLLLTRLVLGAQAGANRGGLDTIPAVTTFFARKGFVVTRAEDDHYGPGIHRRDMELPLTEATVATLRAELARLLLTCGVEVAPDVGLSL